VSSFVDAPRARPTASLPRDLSGLHAGASAAAEAGRPAVLGVQPAAQLEAPKAELLEGYRAIRGLSETTLFHAYRNAVVSGEDLA
jgi:hypothetical protein